METAIVWVLLSIVIMTSAKAGAANPDKNAMSRAARQKRFRMARRPPTNTTLNDNLLLNVAAKVIAETKHRGPDYIQPKAQPTRRGVPMTHKSCCDAALP